ncbi:ammonium transporter [Zavarzinia sp. CC-PAN008]|uniref:ammonium transporter n=1 Tax=Zavarzinia sp. CC-PAN008 TaxID=3243332 RepID=UPI003F74A102
MKLALVLGVLLCGALVMQHGIADAVAQEVTAPAADAPAAAAPAAEAPPPTIDSGNTAWMLTSTALVLFMTIPGLALFYGGMVRKKNVLAMLMQSFAICALASVIWMVVGYSLAFTEGSAFIGGFDKLFLSGVTLDSVSGSIPETVFITFQMTFAIITPALITGAFADRMKFSALVLFTILWATLIYPAVCHWVWGPGGFLLGDGVLDYAGGTVVHINAGIAGLVAAIVLGKRLGYGREQMAPHNLTLSLIGASMLWVGWFGFNAGSAAAADARAGMAMLATQVATAGAALGWMFIEWILKGKPSVLGIISGAVAGLVAVTPAAGFVGPGGGLAIGIASGIICFWASTSLKHMLGYDDSLDVFGVHAVGGIVGAILTGVFAVEAIGGVAGALEGNAGQVVTQIYGILATIVFSAVGTFILLKIVDVIVGLRVDEESEREGLDIRLHGETVQ